jgi:uncharacterized protein YqhQ
MGLAVEKQFTSIGGQAVIEGVMMKSPNFIATTVRKPDASMLIENYRYYSVLKKYPLLAKPFLRGVVSLVETMIQGISSLNFSAEIAGIETVTETTTTSEIKTTTQEPSKLAMGLTMAFSFAMGMVLFVATPHLMTAFVTSDRYLGISADSPVFHLIDGFFKMIILISYIYLISLMKDIKRVFQYHGAEHKSIYTFEAGEELTVENAKKYSTLHPRCGTSFLLFLVVISILMFSILLPILGLTHFSSHPIINHLGMIAAKMVLMFPVAGVSYEFIKFCACRMNHPVFKILILPGLLLQKITTKEPSDDQLEVALVSLRRVLQLEKDASAMTMEENVKSRHKVKLAKEITLTHASVAEFPEL